MGWDAAVVERWNQWAKIRQDLYGFADLLVIRPETRGLLAVQATSGNNVAARISKISNLSMVRKWLHADLAIEVWGWRKLKVKRGGKAVRWTLRRVAAHLNGLRASGIEWVELDDPSDSGIPLLDVPGEAV